MMKKNILMLIAAAAVLSAVICAAGCISADEEDSAAVLGTWYHGDDSFEAVFTLAENHTGVYCLIKDDAGKTGAEGPFPRIDFLLWNMDGDKLSMVCEDGRTITGSFDETDGSLMTDRLGIGYKPVDLAGADSEEHFVWYYEDELYSEISIDMADGTGVYYSLDAKTDKGGKPTGELTGSSGTYTWVPNAEGTGDLTTYSDGTLEHNTYGEDYATLISDRRGGIVYDLMPDAPTAFACMLAWAADHNEDNADVLGTWYCGDDSFEAVVTLAEDNTGVLIAIRDDDDRAYHPGSLPYTHVFTWSVDGNKITYVFENEFARQFTFDEKTGFLTDGDYVFEPVDLAVGDADIEYVWYYEDELVSDVSIDMADGTGIDYRLEVVVDKNGNPTGKLTGITKKYTWELDAEGNDVTIYSDGTVEHNARGEKSGTIITDIEDDALYEIMPDAPTAFACMLAWAAEKLA